MKDGFVKVAAGTPDIKVADCIYNREQILEEIQQMDVCGAKIMVFPELCLTGYTCGDLFFQEQLLASAKEQLLVLARETEDVDALIFVGLPYEHGGKLYNTAAVLNRGKILGLVPKYYPSTGKGSSESRYFHFGIDEVQDTYLNGERIPFGADMLFACVQMPKLVVGVEIGSDSCDIKPVSADYAHGGASVIVNPSAHPEMVGSDEYYTTLVKSHSMGLICAYVHAAAGEGESTTDFVFGGRNMIAENGTFLAKGDRFVNQTVYADADINHIIRERRMTSFPSADAREYELIKFDLNMYETAFHRVFSQSPFIPEDVAEKVKRCDEIFTLQALGLKKRLVHTNCKSAVIGMSGGLDSTLAILVIGKAFDMAGIPRENITAVTMPCFGTTDRTYNNACELSRRMGAVLKEVDIKAAVRQHFKDIGQEEDNHDVTYENSQARERTQILMDMANQTGGMVIGTGDLSELALGWATYNGDHMSMYCVNGSVPKTLVRHLVRYYADTCGEEKLAAVLLDVLDTPVSPELLPPKDGEISQKTEDLVGPYELHDFFLYYILRMGYGPKKIYRIAKEAFKGVYDDETILKWLRKFYFRFFSQQFKRSCLPDGPKVGSVGVSPRGDLIMPSDACVRIWVKELEDL